MARGRWSGLLVGLLGLSTALLALPQVLAAADDGRDAARAELRRYLEDIAGSSILVYALRDDLGRPMEPGAVVAAPDGQGFAMAYFVWQDGARVPSVELATSSNLVDWIWRVRLAESASQPTIEPASDAGYVVGWEKEPPNRLQFAWYPSWDELILGSPAKLLDVPMTLSPCAEGTPSLYSASSRRLEVGFHFFAGCRVDRPARGTTDWHRWSAQPQLPLEKAVRRMGVRAGVGDRDAIRFRGFDFTLQEGMVEDDRWETFRIHLYDDAARVAEPLDLRTAAGCVGFANPSADVIELDGGPAILASAFVTAEGGRNCEAGTLLYVQPIQRPFPDW